ncbi:tRNA pseudouridine(55) synthase TruB [Paludibaculum fermentans]|uniref:tRNA pseudouridine synthase B n=1 Tax=Paludibaculum fermentans TaxID=1473598 RepID=A0A7S7SKZ4_PALFE|nr:tRNA pseudouridine(55) synthase TruB [Paludibaculum fermentans]QOY88238.1 tRNA pseudouridine(55) synthase TruB [Paludibaculum fermentans]
MNGVIVVDKPCGWTSHDVVNKVRRIAGTTKVGHLGTLDPLATGVLPLLLNRATRLAQYFTLNEKTYEGTIRFGFSTDSYDADGEPTSPQVEPVLTPESVERSLAPFRGTFQQTPPVVSAKKINGRPAHELARKKIAVEMKPVEVTVLALDVLAIEGATVKVRVHCTAGTYIRSIAHDAGVLLGCGAHLQSLRRTQSGLFDASQARTLEQLSALASENRLGEALIPSGELLPEFPSEPIDQLTETQIRQGRDFRVSPFRDRGDCRYVKALNREGELVAIGEIVMPNLYHPALVL